MFRKLLLTSISLLSLIGKMEGASTVQEAMLQDLSAVKYSMSIRYAPKEWKQEYLGWNLESAFADAQAAITATPHITTKDYQKIFLNFIKSPHDYHANAIFYSTEWSFAPLAIHQIGGRFYIANCEASKEFSDEEALFAWHDLEGEENPEQYEQIISKLQPGDELIAIGGVPTKEVVEKSIKEELGKNFSETGYALATKKLFHKQGKYGEEVPKGSFTITVRHRNTSSLADYTLPWLHVSEKIMENSFVKKVPKKPMSKRQNIISTFTQRDFKVHYAEDLFKGSQIAKRNKKNFPTDSWDDDEDLREKSALPPLGNILWQTEESDYLYAYIYLNSQGKKIGYIYLPTFHYEEESEEVIQSLITILRRFNRNTEALVLDITNNPGGADLFTFAILSMLTDKPLVNLAETEILTQKNVYEALATYAFLKEFQDEDASLFNFTILGYEWSYKHDQALMDYCLKIVNDWNAGKRMTDPIYLHGIETIAPHSTVRYAKPLLLLINEMDFSCADIFAAILQDNQRATLLGTKTAGAGGYILQYPHASQFGVSKYSLTGSLCFRTNGDPIENLGVTPDIPYRISLKDIQEGYPEYIDAVNKGVNQILQP